MILEFTYLEGYPSNDVIITTLLTADTGFNITSAFGTYESHMCLGKVSNKKNNIQMNIFSDTLFTSDTLVL